MKIRSKIALSSLFLVISAIIVFHFIPSVKKDVRSDVENKTEEPTTSSENIEETLDSTAADAKQDTASPDQIAQKTQLIVPKQNRISDSNLAIIPKMVSWGFSHSSVERSIDTIIIHSSYNALGGDVYEVNKVIEEYKAYGVAPHYLVGRDGTVYQLVKESDVAYHAGTSTMPDGRTNVNNFSVGIEVLTTETEKPTDAQYQSLLNLIAYIKKNNPITSILGHNQIAPGRKTDPWNFNWDKIK
jgi:N-acetyl-anhydromuramyl-L-alanine amidase AmpD